MRFLLLLLGVSFSLGTASCGSPSSNAAGQGQYDSPRYYFGEMRTLTLEVAYEEGAEPYTGASFGPNTEIWNFALDNLRSVFDHRGQNVQVNVPLQLNDMHSFAKSNKPSWSASDLLKLAANLRQHHSNQDSVYFFVVFVTGYLEEENATNPNVIGVNVSGTNIIGISKSVVRTSASGQPSYVPKYVEQSALTHELGHALGLVNNGVSLTSAHQDTEHGNHCINTNCVMYWRNEGPTDAVRFVKQYIITGSEVVFGNECLADFMNYRP